MKNITLISVLTFFVMIACAQDTTVISVEKVHTAINDSSDIFLLDVRTDQEFNGPLGHIRGSVLIPLNELQNRMPELEELKEKQIVVICRSGNRSGIATRILNQNGFSAVNMTGGMLAWNKKFPAENYSGDAAGDTVK